MKRPRVWIKRAAAVLLLYVAGYLALPEHNRAPVEGETRVFPSPMLVIAYLPLGWLDAKIFRHTVCIGAPDAEFSGRWARFDP